jgi:hypothetical protein
MRLREIAPNLYQGSIDPLKDGRLPEQINAVLAVGNGCIRLPGKLTRHLPLIEISTERFDELQRKEFWSRKSSDEEIIGALELLTQMLAKGYTVYVHCDAGICRSAGIVSGYLVRSGQCETLSEAYGIAMGDPEWHDPKTNTFEHALDKLIAAKYWSKFDRYFDPLHSLYAHHEWRAMQLDAEE